jgi:acyl carrier protein
MDTPNGDMFERVRMVMARTFKVSPELVTPQSSPGQLPGWDSFGHLTLMMEIEKEFSVRFSTETINHPKSTSEICELLRQTQDK